MRTQTESRNHQKSGFRIKEIIKTSNKAVSGNVAAAQSAAEYLDSGSEHEMGVGGVRVCSSV